MVAVLDADAEDIRLHPERWALLCGDLAGPLLSVQWARRARAVQQKQRGRFLEQLGDFRSARQLLGFASTGLP